MGHSITYVHHWKCDECGKTVDRTVDTRPPEGWGTPWDGYVRDAVCPECCPTARRSERGVLTEAEIFANAQHS